MNDLSNSLTNLETLVVDDDNMREEYEERGLCFIHKDTELIFVCFACPQKSQLKCRDCVIDCNDKGHKGLKKLSKAVEEVIAETNTLEQELQSYLNKTKDLPQKLEAELIGSRLKSQTQCKEIEEAYKNFEEQFTDKIEAAFRSARKEDRKFLDNLETMEESVQQEINQLVELTKELSALYGKICEQTNEENANQLHVKAFSNVCQRMDDLQKNTKVGKVQIAKTAIEVKHTEELENEIENLVKITNKEENIICTVRI